jgi:deoxycytidylate deaminase
MTKTHEAFFHLAAKVAEKALCKKDKCGSVIVLNNKVIGRGYNAPPLDDISKSKCHLNLVDSPKPKSDRTCCVHAECRAIIDALRNEKNIEGSTLYFTRVDAEGNILKSGAPYCTLCSRTALDCGVKYFALWHESSIKLYDTVEYNELSYAFHQPKS